MEYLVALFQPTPNHIAASENHIEVSVVNLHVQDAVQFPCPLDLCNPFVMRLHMCGESLHGIQPIHRLCSFADT